MTPSSEDIQRAVITSEVPVDVTDNSKKSVPLHVGSTEKLLERGQIRLGICAMDRKARSKPMRNILSRLLETEKFDVVIFGDKMILDEDVKDWPVVEYLITFYSSGFPMEKALTYISMRKPVCVNDLPMQTLFWDRRVVLQVLDALNVPTFARVVANRDGGPKVDKAVAQQLYEMLSVNVNKPLQTSSLEMIDKDTIRVDGRIMTKPFVEKPVDGEDHNVIIYFHSKKGGGARRLFRKIGNQSSAFEPEMTNVRMEGSFVYEKFMDVDHSEDIKVYTLGPNYVHAETRKSPVVDGVVRRNTEGKEIRYVAQLSDEEKNIARNICVALKQNICGFDMLRVRGKSYVIDVNGWSFVKGNESYYDRCAEVLYRFCMRRLPFLPTRQLAAPIDMAEVSHRQWRVKSAIAVFRHADRTPKCKMKFSFKAEQEWAAPLFRLLQGRKTEIMIRNPDQLEYIADAAAEAKNLPGANTEQLEQLCLIIRKKHVFSGTKAQLKPKLDGPDETVSKLVIVVKWGGEFTHAARYQSRDIGENMRKDYVLLNRDLVNHTHIFSSSERRVITTAEIFATAFIEDAEDLMAAKDAVEANETVANPPLTSEVLGESAPSPPSDASAPQSSRFETPGGHFHEMTIRKDFLDDSSAAKDEMERVKRKLKSLLRPGEHVRPEINWNTTEEPFQVVRETIDLMKYHRALMQRNYKNMDVQNIQSRWCCGEMPFLFKERWETLFGDWCDVSYEKFEPSRVSELYDSLKYDALHNRVFLNTIFSNPETDAPGTTPAKLHDLYHRAQLLFNLIAPSEYGIETSEKEEIGLLTSFPLLAHILETLEHMRDADHGSASFYFTKESHIHTLVNLVTLSQLPIIIPKVPELDYMAYLLFEVYERTIAPNVKEQAIRIFLSEGAHSDVLDAQLDARHSLQVQPRRPLTDYMGLDEVINTLHQHSVHARDRLLKRSVSAQEGFLPIEGDEIFHGAKTSIEEVRHFRRRPTSIYSGSSEP